MSSTRDAIALVILAAGFLAAAGERSAHAAAAARSGGSVADTLREGRSTLQNTRAAPTPPPPAGGCGPARPGTVEGVARGMTVAVATRALTCAGYSVSREMRINDTFAQRPIAWVVAQRGGAEVKLYYAGAPGQERVIRIEQRIRYNQPGGPSAQSLQSDVVARFGKFDPVPESYRSSDLLYGIQARDVAPEGWSRFGDRWPQRCNNAVNDILPEVDVCGGTVIYRIYTQPDGRAREFRLLVDDLRDTARTVAGARESRIAGQAASAGAAVPDLDGPVQCNGRRGPPGERILGVYPGMPMADAMAVLRCARPGLRFQTSQRPVTRSRQGATIQTAETRFEADGFVRQGNDLSGERIAVAFAGPRGQEKLFSVSFEAISARGAEPPAPALGNALEQRFGPTYGVGGVANSLRSKRLNSGGRPVGGERPVNCVYQTAAELRGPASPCGLVLSYEVRPRPGQPGLAYGYRVNISRTDLAELYIRAALGIQ